MNNLKSKASMAFAMLSLTSLLIAANSPQVNAFSFSDLDVTDRNSGVRELGREIDITDQNSEIRELGREIDITDQNSEIRELGREIDITNQDSDIRELGREVDPSTKVDEWVDDRVNNAGEAASQQAEEIVNNVGEAASQQAEEIGQTSLNFAIQIAMVIGGLVSFLFVLSILRGLMKRIVT
jgi:sorbitol-specific phosphotransferase system component IIA